jgi:putative transposase
VSDTDYACLIRDNDSKYTESFDTVFESEGINIICTPFKAPNANSFAERWVKTLRVECLDNLLVVNESHLRRVLTEYVDYYNSRRPHQSLNQQSPIPSPPPEHSGLIHRRKILGGIINDYFRIAEDTYVSVN